MTYRSSPECVLEIIKARGSHESGVAKAGCMSVRNFFVAAPVNETALEELLPRALSIVSDVVMACGEDLGTLEQALAALRAIVHHQASLASRLESDVVYVLTSQTGVMPMACGNRNVVYHCVSLLHYIMRGASSPHEYINDTMSKGLIRFIVDANANDPAARYQVEAAMDLLSFLSGSSYQSKLALLDENNLSNAAAITDAVIAAMETYPQSATIQGCGCMVLHNIALDNLLRANICKAGGIQRLVSSLSTLVDDVQLVSRALLALSNLMSGAPVDVLRTIDSARAIISAMKKHPHDLYVQVEGASALWGLSARDNALNVEIVELEGASVIANAVSHFIASDKMNEKGLAAIWSLSVSNETKRRVGLVAIEPVVNGLAASISSDQVVSNGLGCLKCLSTISTIRTLLERSGSIDLVYSCMLPFLSTVVIVTHSFSTFFHRSMVPPRFCICGPKWLGRSVQYYNKYRH